MPMQSQVKFHFAQHISRASQQSSISKITEVAWKKATKNNHIKCLATTRPMTQDPKPIQNVLIYAPN